MSFLSLRDEINRNQVEDRVMGVPFKLPKLDDVLFGQRQATYYLYGAETGIGKTTFVREKHIYQPYELFMDIGNPDKFDVIFVDCSLEISEDLNIAAGMVRHIYLKYGKVIPVSKLLGWSGKLKEEELGIVNSKEVEDYFLPLSKKMYIVSDEITPNRFHDILLELAKKVGTFKKEGRYISECEGYELNNPNLYVYIIVDTANLVDPDSGHDTVKSSIDRMSRIAVRFRNKCKFIPVFIQQFNADISDTERRTKQKAVKTPQLRDFEDSKRCTKDANVAIGLYDPIRHMNIDDNGIFLGYDIMRLRSWFRTAHLLKYRNGPSNIYVPLKFDGEVGVFTELKPAEQMTPQDYLLATRHDRITN